MEFSVLLPVYAKENATYLKEALDSIINQTKVPNQIVIIKDGKLTEELEEVLQSYLRKIFQFNKNRWI